MIGNLENYSNKLEDPDNEIRYWGKAGEALKRPITGKILNIYEVYGEGTQTQE